MNILPTLLKLFLSLPVNIPHKLFMETHFMIHLGQKTKGKVLYPPAIRGEGARPPLKRSLYISLAKTARCDPS